MKCPNLVKTISSNKLQEYHDKLDSQAALDTSRRTWVLYQVIDSINSTSRYRWSDVVHHQEADVYDRVPCLYHHEGEWLKFWQDRISNLG